nr:DivIVA domain-containing protein [Plantactinospora endophytica]
MLRQLLEIEPERPWPPEAADHRSAAYRPMWPSQVRARRFTPVRRGRRGVDPAEVRVFLDRVAGDLAWAYAELARTREQNARITDALRRRRSGQVASPHELAGR